MEATGLTTLDGRQSGLTLLQSSPFRSGRRYYAFSDYLKERFGQKVWKIPIDAGFTCPNRDGTKGFGGCTFCNNEGFSPNTRRNVRSVEDQIAEAISTHHHRGIHKFIAYFQAYTNTHASADALRALYEIPWRFPDVVGMSIGTRPDCVDPQKITLIESYKERGEVWIEYGLQTIHDLTQKAINRCHTLADFERAIDLTRDRGIRICAHTILGLPGETREMMLETHRRLGDYPIDGLKIHLLHVMKNTAMARQFERGEFEVLSRNAYVALICDVLEVLRPSVVIQRLHADAPEEVLIAPTWCLDKRRVLTEIEAELTRRGTYQGIHGPK
jgi:uncharacterized protein